MTSGESTSVPPSNEPSSSEPPPGVPPRQPPPGASVPPGPPPSSPPDPPPPSTHLGEREPTARAAFGSTAPFAGSSQSDWPRQATDLVVDTVGRVRDATTGPVLTVARGVVYGTAILILAATALVLVTVAAIRFIDVYLPGDVWSAYLLLGVVFTLMGLALWAKRHPTT